MTSSTLRVAARLAILLCLSLAQPGCRKAPVRAMAEPLPHPVRFLLTFDDGPSLLKPFNPTTAILDVLAGNSVQPRIKAAFFVQTRGPKAGGTPFGRQLLRRVHAEGHVLALHSGSVRGHKSHRKLETVELEQSLADGVEDIRGLSGRRPTMVRPPYWAFDARTLASYDKLGLKMLLTDFSARDGKIFGWHISLRRRIHFRARLREVRRQILAGRLPVMDGIVPVVVTFHDTNDYTARHMDEYLRILIEESERVGLVVAQQPFYADGAQVEEVAQQRAQAGIYLMQRGPASGDPAPARAAGAAHDGYQGTGPPGDSSCYGGVGQGIRFGMGTPAESCPTLLSPQGPSPLDR